MKYILGSGALLLVLVGVWVFVGLLPYGPGGADDAYPVAERGNLIVEEDLPPTYTSPAPKESVPPPEADLSTFSWVEEGYFTYGRDKNALYYHGERLPGSNGSLLRRIAEDDPYYRDDVNVYYKLDSIETDELLNLQADPNTFEILPGGFSRDKDRLYYADNGTWSVDTGMSLVGADPHTFAKLPSVYARDRSHIYVTTYAYEGPPSTRVLPDADPTTFVVLHDALNVARDTDTVFFGARTLPGAQANTFRFLESLQKTKHEFMGAYATDGTTVWFFEEYEIPSAPKMAVVDGADPQTFRNLDGVYGMDQHGIYVRGKKLEADSVLISSYGYGYAKIGSRLYIAPFDTYDFNYGGFVSCPTCDFATFMVADEQSSQDAKHVYLYDYQRKSLGIVE